MRFCTTAAIKRAPHPCPPAMPSGSLPATTCRPNHPFTSDLQSLDSPLWSEVTAVCNTDELSPTFFTGSSSNQSSYQSALPPVLTPLDSLFVPGGPLRNAQSSLSHSLTHLSCIESTLDTLITTLDQHLSHLNTSSHQLNTLRPQTTELFNQSHHLATFTNLIQIPDHLPTAIHTANPHSPDFASALQTLCDKLSFTSLPPNIHSLTCQQSRATLILLQTHAVDRIHARLEQTFHLLRQPSSSFDILRDTLLYNQRHLLQFLADHAAQQADHLATQPSVLQEYLDIARSAMHSRVTTYATTLSEWASIHAPYQPHSLRLGAIARGTTGIFSAIIAHTVSAGTTAAVNNDGLRGEEVLHVGMGKLQRRQERLRVVLQRWTDAICAMEKPWLTQADLMMRQRGEEPSVEEFYRNVALFFADIVDKEKAFLNMTFGEEAGEVVEDVVAESGESLLKVLEAEVAVVRCRREGLVGLLICLLLNRKYRCGISTTGVRDARVSFLVKVETTLQTGLLEEFDHHVKKLAESLVGPVDSGLNGLRVENMVMRFATIAADMFAIVGKGVGQGETDSADIVSSIHRRLVSSMKQLVETIFKVGQQLTDSTSRLRMVLRLTAVVLTVLDMPDDLIAPSDTLMRMKEPALDQLNKTSEAYGISVAEQHNVELVKAISAIESEEYDAARSELAQFKEGLDIKIRSIDDCYQFLRKQGNVSESLQRKVEQAAFLELAGCNEKVSRLVREHMPTGLHLLVTRSAFGQASEAL